MVSSHKGPRPSLAPAHTPNPLSHFRACLANWGKLLSGYKKNPRVVPDFFDLSPNGFFNPLAFRPFPLRLAFDALDLLDLTILQVVLPVFAGGACGTSFVLFFLCFSLSYVRTAACCGGPSRSQKKKKKRTLGFFFSPPLGSFWPSGTTGGRYHEHGLRLDTAH